MVVDIWPSPGQQLLSQDTAGQDVIRRGRAESTASPSEALALWGAHRILPRTVEQALPVRSGPLLKQHRA